MTNEEAIKQLLDAEHCLAGHGDLWDVDMEAFEMAIKALKQEPDTWSLEDAREDFVDDVYNTLDFLPTNDEANQIIDSFDRVTSSIRREPCENCISKEAALNTLDYIDKVLDEDRTVEKYKEMLKECYEVLPSVTSQQTSTLDKIRYGDGMRR